MKITRIILVSVILMSLISTAAMSIGLEVGGSASVRPVQGDFDNIQLYAGADVGLLLPLSEVIHVGLRLGVYGNVYENYLANAVEIPIDLSLRFKSPLVYIEPLIGYTLGIHGDFTHLVSNSTATVSDITHLLRLGARLGLWIFFAQVNWEFDLAKPEDSIYELQKIGNTYVLNPEQVQSDITSNYTIQLGVAIPLF